METDQISKVRDVREVPLQELAETTGDETLRRVIPADGERVPVAAFNASL